MKRMPVLAAGALAASGALLALTGPAQADPPDHAQAHGVVSHHTGADSKAEQQAVRRYWTKKRMRHAIARDAVRPTGKPSGNGKPGGGGGGKGKPGGSTSDASLGSIWAATPQRTIGKVFFTLGGTNYVCSGNAIDWSGDSIDSQSTVSTAGHCVSDGAGKYATKFTFVPAYDSTKSLTAQPYGSYVASKLVTTAQWDAQQPSTMYDYDVAFAKLGISGGRTVEDAVGSTNIAFNATEPGTSGVSYSQAVHSFGYPAARPYDGTKLASCWGTTSKDTYGGSGDYRLRCNLTGGSSGGPWLRDSGGGVGTVQISVNSFGYTREKDAMYGPVFGPTAQAVYQAAR